MTRTDFLEKSLWDIGLFHDQLRLRYERGGERRERERDREREREGGRERGRKRAVSRK